MKTFAMCMQCQIKQGRTSFEPFIADYFDDGIAQIECSAGHKTALMMQSQKFEMLLNSGATALLQGFTLEACASFAAALERFYEFALRVVCAGRKMPSELFDAMLKPMSRQSERQLGAFMLLHALEFDSKYEQPKAKIIKECDFVGFRNAVIHRGLIPTAEEARNFGAVVYREIHDLFGKISGKHSAAIDTIIAKELARRRSKIPENMVVSTSAGGNLFSVGKQDNPQSFNEAIALFEKQLEMIKTAIPEMAALHKALEQVR